ncbi:syntaxin-17 [Acipenser oxyrinchus oxyrinchus]|uniref:Syntaxin-17 n=1 Tax=Acipenser oxyrinchus oxyrinchus TaxID=40147 RepID=A0AAD8GFG1_ACIOX|nr:syntaxin-17 [Acipenser oxyrinchus oxyrinchus]
MADDVVKLPLRRLELPIHKFVKVAIPIDLERLKKHQINIEKYQRCRQWDKLHQEHIHASRTVQQLRANIREMEKLCQRVRGEDTLALDKIILPIRQQASTAAVEFLRQHSESAEELNCQYNAAANQHSNLTRSLTDQGNLYSGSSAPEEGGSQAMVQMLLPFPEIPKDQNAAESWETLEEDLIELNGLVNEFSEVVHSQQEKIDSIEDNVNSAAANVQEGTKNLGKAAKYKLAVLPVAGALIGGVVGGPIGLLAGFKVAGVAAAVSGGLLGYAGGNLLQKNRKTRIDQDLKQLSISCPALNDQSDSKSE